MLCQFSFQNFKSFKEEAFLDYLAEPIKDNKKSLIIDKLDGEKFLPVISIYGPNGGGKSTVLEALIFLRAFLLKNIIPFDLSGGNKKDEKQRLFKMLMNADVKEKYHKFDPECKNQPTSFDILFRVDNQEFRYQLSLVQSEIVEENLYMKTLGQENANIIFERNSHDSYLSELLQGISAEKIKNTMPLLAHIFTNYDIDMIDRVVEWLQKISVLDYDNPMKESSIILPKTKTRQKKVFGLLHKMDIHISDLRVEKDLDGNITNLYAKHVLPNGRSFEIPFEDESSGTRKLFSCLAEILDCLREGRLIIADELDAKLHPKLFACIIELFTDISSNKKGAQLLLTSHDITTMNPTVYRRDEIWFCALNPENASTLYSLISFKKENGQPPRNDETYGKQYLEGRYGADPYIRRILDWGECE